MTTSTPHAPSTRLIACHSCGLVVDLPELTTHDQAHCPRCHSLLTKQVPHATQHTLAYASAAMIMLVLSLSFNFMSFSAQGLTQSIFLFNAVDAFIDYQDHLLALLLLSTIILLPALYLVLVLVIYGHIAKSHHRALSVRQINWCRKLIKVKFSLLHWVMADVFLIGVLVSLVKIASLAEIALGASFWAYCAFVVLLVKTSAGIDRLWLWQQFLPLQTPAGVKAGDTAATRSYLHCPSCLQLHAYSPTGGDCQRCHSRIKPLNPSINLQYVWALLLAAVVFYFPANLYPIMTTMSLGQSEPSTIMQGVIVLWGMGSYPISMIIFIASVLIPLAKMFVLAWLYLTVSKPHMAIQECTKQRLKLYEITEFIGRWSMIDVFVVAILVALVQLNQLMAIYPGLAALCFAVVVVLTMLSAIVFDPRLLWLAQDQQASAQQTSLPPSTQGTLFTLKE